MTINAEHKGLIDGPIPIGKNQENTIETIAARLNGVKVFENNFAALISAAKYCFTII